MKSTNNNNADYYIKITENGPYLVYGLPSIDEDIIEKLPKRRTQRIEIVNRVGNSNEQK